MEPSSTIDIGIDLGTTNSVAAVFLDGRPQIVKSGSTSADVTPSCVRQSAASTTVGGPAREMLPWHPEETFVEFKRHMGTTWTARTSGDEAISPERLSGLVLQSIRQDLNEFIGVSVDAAVITVPAAFDVAQIAATVRAGEMAGFHYVETIQEPVAAALSYAFNHREDGYYVVFDLGGGTFDVALLECRDGIFTVVAHEGDNNLGAGLWDDGLVELVILPELRRRGASLPLTARMDEPHYLVLKDAAERARIALSRQELATVELGAMQALLGGDLPADVALSRDQFEVVAQPEIRRATTLTEKLVADSGISKSAIRNLILVGGPTRTPVLRRAVDALDIPVAVSVDPMTAVAKGAALYAASRRLPQSWAPVANVVSLAIDYEAMVEGSRQEVLVGVRIQDTPDAASVRGIRLRHDPGEWESAEIPLTAGGAIARAPLQDTGATRFEISAWTSGGGTVPVSPSGFTVTKGVAATAAPVNHSLGVGVDHLLTAGAGGVDILVPKGSTPPIAVTRPYRTTRALQPGSSEPIRLSFLEGESSDPSRNLLVGQILISMLDIRKALPAGEEVKITLRVEAGRDPACSAFIPFLDQEFTSVLRIGNKNIPNLTLLGRQVESAKGFTSQLTPLARENLDDSERHLDRALKGDDASAFTAAARLSHVLDEVDQIDAESRAAKDADDLTGQSERTGRLVQEFGSEADREHLSALQHDIGDLLSRGSLDEIRYRRDLLVELGLSVAARQPAFWVAQFERLSEKAQGSASRGRVATIVSAGRAAIARGDIDSLRTAVIDLWGEMPEDSPPGSSFGIRRTR